MGFSEVAREYFQQPSAATWSALREQITNAQGFNPDSGVIAPVAPLLRAGQHQRVIDYIDGRMPAQFLNPLAHTLLAAAHRKLGADGRARAHLQLARIAHRTIADSGDGSARAPYRVLRVEDEYGFLQIEGLTSQSQSSADSGGMILDVHDCGTGTPVHFVVEGNR